MNDCAVWANFLDASALIKLYVDEDGSDTLKGYIQSQSTYYTTPFCFYEALNAFKRKWSTKVLTKEQYCDRGFQLTAWFSHISGRIRDLNFTESSVFSEVQRLVQRHDIDFSDALQILSVKAGFFSHLVGDSRTLFVTADKKLAEIAKDYGLRTWFLMEEPCPVQSSNKTL